MENGRVGLSFDNWHPAASTLKRARRSSDRGFTHGWYLWAVENEKSDLALGWLMKLQHQVCPLFVGCWKLLEKSSPGAGRARAPPSAQPGFCESTWAHSSASLPLWCSAVGFSLALPGLSRWFYLQLMVHSSLFSKPLCIYISTPIIAFNAVA